MGNCITRPVAHASNDMPLHTFVSDTRRVSADASGGDRRLPSSALTNSSVPTALQERSAKVAHKINKGPCVSEKRPTTIDLNGVLVYGRSPLVCRHISMMFATASEAKKSAFTDTLSTRQGLAAQVRSHNGLDSLEADYERTITATPAAAKHVISGQDLGLYLSSLVHAMESPSEQNPRPIVNCLLLTGGQLHAMAMEVEKKSRDGVESVTVKMYDPNATNTYKSVVVKDASDDHLKHLTIEQMLVNPVLAKVYGSSILVVCLDAEVRVQLDRQHAVQNRSEAHLFIAMAYGSTADVRNMLKIESESSSPKLQMLRANNEHGSSGLLLAYFFGLNDTIKAYAEALQDFGIDKSEIIKLMLLKDSAHGDSAPTTAFQEGHSDTIKVTVQSLKDLGIEKSDIAAWVTAETSDGMPGSFLALHNGHSDTIKVAVQLLKDLGVPKSNIATWLTAKSGSGTPGSYVALRYGNSETIKVAVELLRDLDVPHSDIATWLTAESGDGSSGSFTAYRKGHTEAIKVTVELLKELGVEISDIHTWLTAER